MKHWFATQHDSHDNVEAPRTPRRVLGRSLRWARGQSMVEYVLIVTLVVLAIAASLALLGSPTNPVGNIFSNTVYNLLGGTLSPYSTLTNANLADYQTAIASYTPPPNDYTENTPAAPTCQSGYSGPTLYEVTDNAPGGAGTFVPCG